MEDNENKQVGAPAEEVQPVKTESARCLDHLKCALLVHKLAGTDDAIAALQLIDDYFQGEKSATDYSLDGSKEYVNTTDEGLLFPQLEIAVQHEIKKRIRDADQRARAEHYVTVYMERWQTYGAGSASDGLWLPANMEPYRVELDTKRARQYFPIAIERDIIEKTQTGYRKKNGISLRQLAYFLNMVYPGKKGDFPDKAVSILFNENRISKTISRLSDNTKTYGKPRGYEEIDKIFEQ